MEKIIDVTTACRQFFTFEQTTSHSSSKQKEMLEELHSLPTILTDQDSTAILRKIRKQRRIQASANYGK